MLTSKTSNFNHFALVFFCFSQIPRQGLYEWDRLVVRPKLMAYDIGILILETQHFAQVFICFDPFLIITKGRVLWGLGSKRPEADDILTF